MTKTTAIRRIQKLKALAEGEAASGNAQAAESAARIAAKLMVEHAIAESEVADPYESDPMVRTNVSTGRRLAWLRLLYAHVAKANNCTTAYRNGTDVVVFYGRQSDCEIAAYLGSYLAREVQRATDRRIRGMRRSYGYVPRGERNGFAHSAVQALGGRLRALRREAVSEAQETHGEAAASNALVVLDNRLAAARDFQDQFAHGKGRRVRYESNAAGYRAGQNINIHAGIGGSDPAARLT